MGSSSAVGRSGSVLGLVATAAVTAALISGAALTVLGAQCQDPGRLVTGEDGVVVLEGGCVRAEDLLVPGAPLPAPTGATERGTDRP